MAKWESRKWILWHSDFAVLSLEHSSDTTLRQALTSGTGHSWRAGVWAPFTRLAQENEAGEMLTHIPWLVPAPLPGTQVSSGETPPLRARSELGLGRDGLQNWAVQLAKCRTRKAQQRCWNGAAETAPSSCLSVALPQRQSRKALNTS